MRRLEQREAAHIVHLLPTSNRGIFGDKGPSESWRQDLQKKYKDLRSYNDEVKDQRVKVHLKEITSTDDAISINSIGKWQRIEARRLHTRLKQDTSVLEVATEGSFWLDEHGRPKGSGEIQVQSVRPVPERCYMDSHVRNTSEVELAALLRGLQIARDMFRDRAESREFRQYRRIIITTGSIMSLQTLTGSGSTYRQNRAELERTTQIAALCRIEAAEILKAHRDIASIHFIWLPQLKHAR